MASRREYPKYYQDTRSPTAITTASINGGKPVIVNSQQELDAIHRAVAEGKPLSFKSAPGRKR